MSSSHHHRRALIAAAHAYPDPAIGARRVSELANHLVNRGWQVKILAADGEGIAGGGRLDPAVERIGIRLPQPLYSLFQGLVPEHWRGNRDADPRPAAPDLSASTHTQATRSRSRLVEALRAEYFRYTDIVDNRKRWSLRLARRMFSLTREWQPSVALVSGPEWSPVVAASVVCRLRRLPLVVDFRDPWLGRGGFASPLYEGARRAVDAKLESRSVNTATVVTVSSARLLEELKERYPARSDSIHLIRNGYDSASWSEPTGPTGRLDLLHAGTIYFNRSPMPLLEGLCRFLGRPYVDRQRISVTMIGDCARWRGLDLAAWARARGVDDVLRIEPPVTFDRVRNLTANSSVLITFAQGQPTQVPGKLFEQIAANREVLLFTERNSESADVVRGLPWFTIVDDNPLSSEAYLASAYERHVQMKGSVRIDPARSAAFARVAGIEKFETLMVDIASKAE